MRDFIVKGVFFLVFLPLTLVGCRNRSLWGSDDYDSSDSLDVAVYVEGLQNPTLLSTTEVLELQKQMIERDSIDKIFVNMTTYELKNVCEVLLHKSDFVQKEDIVKEFMKNKDIYSVVSKEKPVKPVDRTATDLGNRRDSAISTSFRFRTDTVDGKLVKIRIKTEEFYE